MFPKDTLNQYVRFWLTEQNLAAVEWQRNEDDSITVHLDDGETENFTYPEILSLEARYTTPNIPITIHPDGSGEFDGSPFDAIAGDAYEALNILGHLDGTKHIFDVDYETCHDWIIQRGTLR
jgi:hypothetical protein